MYENEIFGYKRDPNEIHSYSAICEENNTKIIVFDRVQFEEIVTKTELSASELKIEFLNRFVPKLRGFPRNLIEELEVFFIKEVGTQGYHF